MTATGSFCSALVLVLTLWALPACSSWELQRVPIAVVLEAEQPARIRVAAAARSVTLSQPSIRGDSLVGTSSTGAATVALADVTGVWVRRSSPVAALVLVPLVLGISLVAALIAASPLVW